MLLRSAIVASVLLGSSLAAAAGPGVVPVKATKPAKRAPAKKKAPARARARTGTVPPSLSDAQLGLADYKVSSIKAAEQDTAPAASPPPAPPPSEPSPKLELEDRDKVLAPGAGPTHRFSIELNPLAAVAGRYGLNVEYVPFVHHAIIGSAFYQTFPTYALKPFMPTPIDPNAGASGKAGGEIGYRYYSGRRGANGFFAGASAVVMPLAAPRLTQEQKGELTSFYAYGGAIDIGIQGITDSGFTIGAGIGGMYLAYDVPKSAKTPTGAEPFKVSDPHVLPRVLFAAGWSF